jgi:hypothetical protein
MLTLRVRFAVAALTRSVLFEQHDRLGRDSSNDKKRIVILKAQPEESHPGSSAGILSEEQE